MRRYAFHGLASLAVGLSLLAGPSYAQQPATAPTTATTAPAPAATTTSPAPTTTTAPAPDPNASPEERAMALFRKGIEAHKQGNLTEAEGYYRTAFDLKKSYDIAGNLGDVELKLGKPRDAAEHLSFTIKNFPLTGKPDLRDRMQKSLDEAKRQVGAVRISVNVDRADIFVDGSNKIGQAPMSDEYFVDPGQHSFEARLKGYKSAQQSITATKGTLQEIKLTLIAIAPPPPPKRSKAPAVALGVGAAVGFGAGLGLFLLSNSKLGDAEQLTKTILAENGTCREDRGTVHASCADLASTKKTVNTLDGLAIGAASLGGLALVGMVVYLALPNPAAPTTRTTGLNMKLVPTAGRDSGGFLISGSF